MDEATPNEEMSSSSASSLSSPTTTSDTSTSENSDQDSTVLEEEVLPKLAELLSNAGVDTSSALGPVEAVPNPLGGSVPEAVSKSPTPSLEDLDCALFPGEDSIITLQGEIPIGSAIGWPSFKYKYLRYADSFETLQLVDAQFLSSVPR